MGHTECGAVAAAISGPPLAGKLRDIQEKIEPVALRIKKTHPGLKGSELENAVVKANALRAKNDLFSRSPQIRRLAESGKLKVLIAVYDIMTGRVEWAE